MSTKKEILPPPIKGQEIYIPRAIYGGEHAGPETGGRAIVRKVILSSSTHVIYCEDISPAFHWDMIGPQQEALRAKHGDKRAGPVSETVEA